jgi:hypothetical protein
MAVWTKKIMLKKRKAKRKEKELEKSDMLYKSYNILIFRVNE